MNQVQEALKQAGYNRNQVSVKRSRGSYTVSLKTFSIHPDTIKPIVQSFERIHYCQASGEILSGGNTFVSIQYDWKDILKLKESNFYRLCAAEVIDAMERVRSRDSDTALEYVGSSNYLIGKSYNSNTWIGRAGDKLLTALGNEYSLTIDYAIGILNGSITER